MTGWLLCILGSGYVSMALEQPDSTVLLSLLLLYVMSGILLMQFQYMYSERSIGYKFYLEVDAPRDKCAHFREINGIAAAFHYLQKNYNPTASFFL
ncbi:hypothetical protein ACI5N7_004447 [Salmonella enterica subsp. enterica serovar Derby]